MSKEDELIRRLIEANENSCQSILGSYIFYKAAEMISHQQSTINELKAELEKKEQFIDGMVKKAAEKHRPAYDEQQRIIAELKAENEANREDIKRLQNLLYKGSKLNKEMKKAINKSGLVRPTVGESLTTNSNTDRG